MLDLIHVGLGAIGRETVLALLGRAQTAEAVARKIAQLIRRPQPELWPVPGSAWLLALAAAFPRLADQSTARTVGNRKR